jgi:hypothetical protein
MGRPATLREPVELAIVDLLTPGPMPSKAVIAEVMRRTGASAGTIRQWGRPLCDPIKRGRPGDPDAGWWWRLKPEITGIGPKITATAAATRKAPKMTGTPRCSGDSPKVPSTMAQSTEHVGPREMSKTAGLSLLDGPQRSSTHQRHPTAQHHGTSEREAVLDAFAMSIGEVSAYAVTLTSPPGDATIEAALTLAEAVDLCGGGLWLTPQPGEGTEHEHHHGVVVGMNHERVIAAWVRLTGGLRSAQVVKPIDGLSGWLAYCRRKPGFDPSRVIASGSLRDSWSWALGKAGITLPPSPPAEAMVGPMLRIAVAALQAREAPSNAHGGHPPHGHQHPATAAARAR